jgi:hypothetical protein
MLQSRDYLAGAYQDASRMGEALPLFEEALKLCKTKLGLGHPFTLTAMNYLASAYLDARRWAGAEALARDALTRRAMQRTHVASSPRQEILDLLNLLVFQTETETFEIGAHVVGVGGPG